MFDKWSIQRKMYSFGVGRKIVKGSKALKNKLGIFGKQEYFSSRGISTEIVTRVKNFYCDEEGINSRFLPGLKDRVRIAKDVYLQKRLLLCNLKELYALYKEKYPNDKVGFTKFCELRPKHCVLAGSRGTYSVCVCALNQNFKLLISACNTKFTFKDVISKITCDPDNRDCMFCTCSKYPDRDKVEEILNQLLFT